MLRILIAAIFLALPGALFAQGAPKAILVLDGSGSMWGQIDGVNKIVIARQVIADLLDTLPADQELGLMSYGHRRKGDCSDIELLIEPGTDRAAIARAVNAINPTGKTPLSAAVIEAAEALRYTEEPATVILVSDGIETCDHDPCAVGRMLEEAGIGFTAHVIGFDVADPEALAQLQCLAEETGGSFRTAANAEELADALAVVTEPAPEPVRVTFRALDGPDGPVIGDGLVWTIGTEAGGTVLDHAAAAAPVLDLLPGQGVAAVLRTGDEATAEAPFSVAAGDGGLVVTLVLPTYAPPAALDAPASAPAGSLVAVTWDGPDAEGDYLTTAEAGMGGSEYRSYAYLRDGAQNVVMLRMPPEPGPYQIRYILTAGNKVLAVRPIEATPLAITLTPPENPTIGQTAQVGWVGPDYERDYIAVARPEADDGDQETYGYTQNGTPAQIQMPAEPGLYELRYVLGVSHHVAARVPFEVGDVATSISAPAEAPAGSVVAVSWVGPDARNDYIAVAPVGSEDTHQEGYTYTSQGSPLELGLPIEPGAYELRYVLNLGTRVLARAPITLTPVTAALEAPDAAPAGSMLSVGWTGPGYERDFVTIVPVGARDSAQLGYAYVRNGNPAEFRAPTEPGEYELRYVANTDPDEVLARRAITVTEVSATLAAPESIPAAATLAVDWTGPGGDRDYIAVALPGDDAGRSVDYAYAREGNPVELQAPTAPGDYELRYVLAGDPKRIIARRALAVAPVSARIEAPAAAPAGGTLQVAWQGPGYRQDFVAIARPGDRPGEYESYEYVRNGNPVELDLPDIPGRYELRYVVSGDTRAVIASQDLTVE